ncbi:DUF3017 domain-containing protein [Streptomyces sp. NPDC054796]
MSAEPGASTPQGGGALDAVRGGAARAANAVGTTLGLGRLSRLGGGKGDKGGEGEGGRKSRRFPLLTRDTARPEGGGRAAGGDAPAPYRQWPLLAVCGGVLIGLLVTVLEFRAGTIIIGLSMLGGAVLRWALPSVGMLAVRSRFTDMVTYGVLGFVITLLAMMAQPKPWVTIPFLEAIVRFAVR